MRDHKDSQSNTISYRDILVGKNMDLIKIDLYPTEIQYYGKQITWQEFNMVISTIVSFVWSFADLLFLTYCQTKLLSTTVKLPILPYG